jgi:pyroglutamyl-peptidase
MLTVLLTGFEPFGGAADNPSRQAVLALAAAPPPGIRLATEILPVTYAQAGPALRAAIIRHRPDVLLATGVAGGRSEISVERIAINIDDARIADNAGERRIDMPVVADGPAAYFAGIAIKSVTAAIRAAGLSAQVSQSAGTFLCNHIFYLGCHLAATEHPYLRVGFLHLPPLADRTGEPADPLRPELADLVTALRAAIDTVARPTPELRVAEGATD